MKSTAALTAGSNYTPTSAYPNGATKQDLFRKLIDLMLVAAIGIGAAAILLFLLALA